MSSARVMQLRSRWMTVLLIGGVAAGCAGRSGPLHQAVAAGDNRRIEQLIADGADLEAKEYTHGETALHVAAEHGRDEVAEVLLEGGADVDNRRSFDGQTTLHPVAFEGYRSLAELLVFHNADVNARDAEAHTPLHFAVLKNNAAVAKLLADRGATVRGDFQCA